jgi:hypothetical protein
LLEIELNEHEKKNIELEKKQKFISETSNEFDINRQLISFSLFFISLEKKS